MKRLTRLFSAWKGGPGRRGAPPPPDSSQPIRVDARGEKLVDVVTSAAGDRRVGITRDGAGLYRLRVETWAPEWDTMGVASWFQASDDATFTDSIDRARALAEERLRAAGDPGEADEPHD